MTQPPAADGIPGRQHLTGYRLRNYRHAVATLAASRTAQRLTLTALAPRVGSHRQEIGRWLLGDVTPAAPRLFDLAHALGYDLALIPKPDTDVIPDQRGLCEHCGTGAYWDGRRWRHETSRLAACPDGRTSATVDLALIPREDR